MLRNRIGWQFFFICYLIAAFALWFSTWYSIHIYKASYLGSLKKSVTVQSTLLLREFTPALSENLPGSYLDSLSKLIGNEIGIRLTIMLPSGEVIGESSADPDTMENHLYRPEMSQAVQGNPAYEVRYSNTLNENMLYYAVPIYSNSSLSGVLRLAVPLGDIRQHVKEYYHQLVIVSIVLFIILGIIIVAFSNILSKPIRLMRDGALRFASGEFDQKLQIPKGEELAELAKSLNVMAESLNDRIQTITRQRNELTTILVSLNEGVIAADNDERIISINPAAAKILNITQEAASGRYIHEIIRNSALQKFLISTLSNKDRTESTFVISGNESEIHIHAYGTLLVDKNNKSQGAVLVLNDITKIRKLENHRKDFIANVSHELRTPLTSIKGFVETIRMGDYDLPDEVSRFLMIISSKTDNLCSIVEDILTLSSIERDSEHREIEMVYTNIASTIQDAINTCYWKAEKKNIHIIFNAVSQYEACINATLIEQAIVNILENAIKFSNEKSEIIAGMKITDNELIIFVQDHGCGIAKEHLGRVFERFYRVDKARSRKLGGTGLGLSIVKNIVAIHYGTVTVESEIGKGSIFEIHLPRNDFYEKENSDTILNSET